ncbi:MAG: CoA-binding protein [Anaerolineae bacterium]|nr:CoA-binding protein [Anaerolineae bacterium]
MSKMQEMVDEFLAQPRIAVAGVSRSPNGTANLIYRKLKATGHTVYAINPNAETVEDGDPAYPDVKSTPEKPDGVMIVTTPDVTDRIVRDCDIAGIKRVWMHCSFAHGQSTSAGAVQYCKDHGIAVIPVGCPLMYDQPVDFGHKFIKWWMGMTGKLNV